MEPIWNVDKVLFSLKSEHCMNIVFLFHLKFFHRNTMTKKLSFLSLIAIFNDRSQISTFRYFSFSSQRLSKTVLILTFQEINPIDFYAATHTEQFFFQLTFFQHSWFQFFGYFGLGELGARPTSLMPWWITRKLPPPANKRKLHLTTFVSNRVFPFFIVELLDG